MPNKRSGKVIIPNGVNVWHHELRTANALAGAGYTVEFLAIDGVRYARSPDIVMDNEKWEIKSPKTDNLAAVERNLKRATKQSGNIVIDSQRMRKIHDKNVQMFLVQKCKQQKAIRKLLFVNVSVKLLTSVSFPVNMAIQAIARSSMFLPRGLLFI